MKAIPTLLLSFLLCFHEAGAKPLPDSFDKNEILSDAIKDEKNELNDPFEPLNRSILYINRLADGLILRPLGLFYVHAIPSPIRKSVGNFLGNLTSPIDALNYSLQGEGKKAGKQFFRFLLNTTIGIFGIFDPATSMGFKKEETDFDATFAQAGIPSGPYIMLPLLGPSTPRHALSRGLNLLLDPFNRIAIYKGEKNLIYYRTGIQIIHTRGENHKLLEVLDTDPNHVYETMRSVYTQVLRAKEGHGDKPYTGPNPSDSWE
jgi:phospholipid-binding lipoprotein MlaA